VTADIGAKMVAKQLRTIYEKAQVAQDATYLETGDPLMVSGKRQAFSLGALVMVQNAEKMAGLKWVDTTWEEIE
jgi:hypothetical protein